MKKSSIILITIIAVIAIVAMLLIGAYNGMVSKRESVGTAYSNLDTQLQRRADLIPNLVNTVKGYTNHETEVIKNITDARAKLMGANTAEEKATANNELTTALNALNVVVENYPDLKASENYINLSDELAGTENRIATARRDYNEVVKSYNTTIIKFPNNIFAGMFGFEKATYFEASEESKEVPSVNFD